MNALREALRHASDGGRLSTLALAAWTFGGGAAVLMAIAIVLALEPAR